MRLMHFADAHIGVETYGRVDPATGRHSRLLDFGTCLNRAVDFALEGPVDAVLFAGDAYRTCYPNPTHQQVFAGAIGRLAQAGVPVVMVAGNHDLPVAVGRATAIDIFGTLAGERVTVAVEPGVHRIETRSGPLQVACLPWPTPSRLRLSSPEGHLWTADELRAKLSELCAGMIGELADALDPAVPGVLLSHLTAEDAIFSGSEQIALNGGDPSLSRGVLADPRFDYVALGHIHRYQNLNDGHRPPVVYPGSLDRIDFGEAADVKGICLVDLTDGPTPAEREVAYRHVPVPARPFVPLKFELPAGVEPTAWLLERLEGAKLEHAVVRLRYVCTDEQHHQIDLSALRRAMDSAFLIAGLIRERPEQERRPRVEITEHHGLADALARYLDSRPELQPLKAELLDLGQALDRELDTAETGGAEVVS